MTSAECHRINANRAAEWAASLSNAHATPVLCLGIGHDHAAGELVAVVPEGDLLTASDYAKLLRQVAQMFDRAADSPREID